jgi:Fe-S cluster assembly ATP-binding protein
VLSGGRVIRTGDKGLALELEERGYDWIPREAASG